MSDDLDDFFDEIDEAVAEVTEQGETAAAAAAAAAAAVSEDAEVAIATANDKGQPKTVEDNVEPESRPAKRIKVAVASAPARPKGAVVAASAASSSTTNKKAQPQQQQSIAPPPPPPPPPTAPALPSHHNSNNRYFGPTTSNNNNNSTALPPLPNGPMPPLPPGPPPPPQPHTSAKSHKPVVRMAAGKSWVDNTLSDWPENDFRIFVGNLGAEVDDDSLLKHFQTRYPSATMSKIVRETAGGKSKGYGFVSFLQPLDCAKAIREQDQAWLGSRPIRVKRSDWQERNKSTVQKKNRNERKQQKKRGGGRLYY